MKEAGGKPKAVFLGDGNAFDLPTEELAEILKLVRKYFPEGPSVRMDATVTGILAKSPEELEQLHSLGVEHLYLGIESGLEEVLAFMKKIIRFLRRERQLQEYRTQVLYLTHIL